MGETEWPPPIDGESDDRASGWSVAAQRVILFRAQVAEVAARRGAAPPAPTPPAHLVKRQEAIVDTDAALLLHYHQQMMEVATTSVDRARAGAQFVQTAATAILGVYTGLLALAFSVSDRPLPLRGLIPGIFLGLSIAMAAAYLAFISRPKPPLARTTSGNPLEGMDYRTAHFVRWVRVTVENRRYFARAAVCSLFAAAVFLPAPFLEFAEAATPVSEEEIARRQERVEEARRIPEPPDLGENATFAIRLAAYEVLLERSAAELVAAEASLASARAANAAAQDPPSWLDESTLWSAAVGVLALVLLVPALVAWAEKPRKKPARRKPKEPEVDGRIRVLQHEVDELKRQLPTGP